MVREVLTNARTNFTAEEMASLCDTRVSPEKYDKVLDQFDKVTEKFRQRIEGVIAKFEAPKPSGKKQAAKAPPPKPAPKPAAKPSSRRPPPVDDGDYEE